MNFLPGESCGLHPSDQYVTWNQFIAESNRKPYCNSYQDSIDGRHRSCCLLTICQGKLFYRSFQWVFQMKGHLLSGGLKKP